MSFSDLPLALAELDYPEDAWVEGAERWGAFHAEVVVPRTRTASRWFRWRHGIRARPSRSLQPSTRDWKRTAGRFARARQLSFEFQGMSKTFTRTEEEIASDKQAQTRKQEYFLRPSVTPHAPVQSCVLHDCAQPLWMGKLCREHFTRMMAWPEASVAALIEREEQERKHNGSAR